MKKSSLITILLIFILPAAMYYFSNASEQKDFSAANASMGMPKVLQFSSAMCYDCKKIEKEIAPLRQEYQGRAAFQKYNISNRTPAIEQMIKKYDINVVPTLIFIDKNGNVARKTEAYAPQNQLRIYLDELIKS